MNCANCDNSIAIQEKYWTMPNGKKLCQSCYISVEGTKQYTQWTTIPNFVIAIIGIIVGLVGFIGPWCNETIPQAEILNILGKIGGLVIFLSCLIIAFLKKKWLIEFTLSSISVFLLYLVVILFLFGGQELIGWGIKTTAVGTSISWACCVILFWAKTWLKNFEKKYLRL